MERERDGDGKGERVREGERDGTGERDGVGERWSEREGER